MALSSSEKVTLVTNALKDHMPLPPGETDSRNLATLKAAFLKKHLDGMVKSYQKKQADSALEVIATETVT
jgi:hypothetical protein